MKKPPIPQDESSRVGELRSLRLLDTPAEERFDRYTRIARRLFDVPIALVSLVDDERQWFKSKDGLSACETSRDISFCGHAINGKGLFVVEDTTQDERFADNPLVTGPPHLRFYAGAPVPLRSRGSALGTLCLIDTKPRKLDAQERTLLRDLADSVGEAILAVDLASIDELTKISNRRGTMSLARKAFEVAKRKHSKLSVLFIDLNDFKTVNDELGHATGDAALVVMAAAMLEVFRDSDVVGRLGGDEFCAVLPTASHEQSQLAVDRLRKTVAARVVPGMTQPLSFSHGIVELDPDRHASVDELFEQADSKMYQQKKGGE